MQALTSLIYLLKHWLHPNTILHPIAHFQIQGKEFETNFKIKSLQQNVNHSTHNNQQKFFINSKTYGNNQYSIIIIRERENDNIIIQISQQNNVRKQCLIMYNNH